MPLDRLSQITEVGIKSGITLSDVNVIGVVTATTLSVTSGFNVTGVVTATSFSGNVTGNITPTGLVVSGVSTFQASSFWGDGDIAYFGDGNDLLIFHNSTDSIIRDDGTGDLFLQGGNRIRLTNPTGIETYAVFNQDGASELWYDNAKKFETTGAGVSITGISSASGGFVGNLTGNVNATGLSTFSNIQVSTGSSITVGSAFIQNNAIGLGQTTTTGRNAGVGTAAGTIIFNATTSKVEMYNGTDWQTMLSGFVASGGTLTFSGGKTIHTFTSSGTLTVSSGSSNVEYLVIGGGGGGGTDRGGGGGAGALRYATGFPLSPGNYTVTVGAGGGLGGDPQGSTGQTGSASVFSSITSPGGGGGGGEGTTASSGGSGGGGAYGQNGAAATGSPGGTNNSTSPSAGWGNPGPNGTSSPRISAGGGGSASSGGSGSPTISGAGGNGLSYSISGTSTTYAGGGGGGATNGDPAGTSGPGPGGPGGGGAGGNGPGSTSGTPGTSNTGGGGGGGGYAGTGTGGNGGSGIVIIAYPS